MTMPQRLPIDFEIKELAPENNVFLIDWLTFVTFVDNVDAVKAILGLSDPSIPWLVETKFRNGYPQQCYWAGITISYGADNPEFYTDTVKDGKLKKAEEKARIDMGMCCVNLSGTGCRTFETYGNGDWNKLFAHFFCGAKYNITRLDLAYDDHIGILDIHQIEDDTRDRAFISKAKYAEIVWSDYQNTDIQGMTVQIGSNKSRTKIRIYDKAAERGFKGRHWVRCEIQLRKENAAVACAELWNKQHIGRVATGILRNYLSYRVPTADSNKSRWPTAPYWDRLILDMERIRLWISPGDEYNFSKTEMWLINQCGQAMLVVKKLGRLSFLLDIIERHNPELAPKYQRVLDEFDRRQRLACADDDVPEGDDFNGYEDLQLSFDILTDLDPDLPWPVSK